MGSVRPSVSFPLALALLALVIALPSTAHANRVGPICWAMSPLGDVFVLFFHIDPSGPDTATVVGTTAFDPPASPFLSPVSGSALNVGDTPEIIVMGLTAAPRPQGNTPARGPMFVNVRFSLVTLVGTGYCTGGSATTCGDGLRVLWTPVACP
jgi:hypothetical protein